jgi:hypothetical protein
VTTCLVSSKGELLKTQASPGRLSTHRVLGSIGTRRGAKLESEVPEHLRLALELAKRLMANGERSEKSDDEAPDDADE